MFKAPVVPDAFGRVSHVVLSLDGFDEAFHEPLALGGQDG
jgi:hypothetical protein